MNLPIDRRFLPALLLAALAGEVIGAQSCTVAVGTLAFGAYAGAQVNSSATLTVTCTRAFGDLSTVNYTASLSAGSSGSYAQRRLTRAGLPADTLNYNLYLTTVPATLNTSVWGDGTGGTVVASGSIAPVIFVYTQTRTHTVAGAIAAGAVPTAGAYSDSIVATLVYN